MPKLAGAVKFVIKLPPNAAVGNGDQTWDIDESRVRDFMKHFGIVNPIKFRWTAGKQTVGCHRLKVINGEREHGITLNQYTDANEARNTILHELCHAIQKDQVDLGDFNDRRRYERAVYGYRNSPIEVEARNFADDMLAEWGDIIY